MAKEKQTEQNESQNLERIVKDYKISPNDRLFLEGLYGKALLSERDALTGLYNNRKLMETLTSLVSRIEKRKESLSIGSIFADIDNFKQINTLYGQESGNVVLKKVTESLIGTLREHEKNNVYRWGGEEFVILVYNTSISGAEIAAERLRWRVEKKCKFYKAEDGMLHPLKKGKYEDREGNWHPIKDPCNVVNVTMSFGVALFGEKYKNLYDVIHASNIAMNRAKAQGKNRVITAY
jgi:diguanylate cyclase (GGDEF)-like protein